MAGEVARTEEWSKICDDGDFGRGCDCDFIGDSEFGGGYISGVVKLPAVEASGGTELRFRE